MDTTVAQQTLDELCRETDQRPLLRLEPDRKRAGGARTNRANREIVLEGDFAELPPPVQQWFIAHEYAHLVLDHRSRLMPYVLFVVSMLIAVAPVIMVSSVPLVFVIAAVPFTLLLGIYWTVQQPQKGRGRAADAQAHWWGFPLTDPVVRDWALSHRQSLMLRLTDDHDSWPDRIRAAQMRDDQLA